ncbi:CaiB/BaiF CoA transferase family protein [Actinophytocola oryzae]|uniref:Benzylsuccinate CoA-transferase BbsE subunit n=1 Tax=Actinophytocola oryzae TaxID=502181 RepID=A0A4R7W4T1_9PSEU|nr:CoA transferase [Actinophytocola oryzae]TDV57740.1 benzylsuccinate CoA-transferase BbsE subunit [Actinophytocola oryzae]
MTAAALAGLRVVELAGPVGGYCGRLFADLGADVFLVEPPGGAPGRTEPPLADATGESLRFAYENAGKYSVTGGRDFLRGLLATADLFVESTTPGELEAAGLGPAELCHANPGLVVTSITPFGRTGPFAGFAGTDLVCLALGGLLSLGGYADGPPVRPPANQALVMANLFAAVASMMAVLHAESTGTGQHVDVAIQECVSMALENAPQYLDLEGIVRGRPDGMQRHAGTGLYPCTDGYVYLYVGGIASGRFWDRLVEWLSAEGVPGAADLAAPQWTDRAYLETSEAKETFGTVFGAFAASRDRIGLYRDAQGLGIPLCPVNTAADVAASEQLRHRDFLRTTVTASGLEMLAPGPPYVLGATPWHSRGGVPAPGEHTAKVRAELTVGGAA